MSRRQIILGVTLLATACVAPRVPPQLDRTGPPAIVRVLVNGSVRSVPLEDYVRAVILSEFHPARADRDATQRMLELQAIVSRTYALRPRHTAEHFDFCSTTHCQLFEPSRLTTSQWTAAAVKAVSVTRGVVVRFGDRAATTVFHADCGGHTSAAADVWNGDALPYLAAVVDGGPAADAHTAWRFAATTVELLAALNANRRTRVGATLERIDILERDVAGRAQAVALVGARTRVVRGEDFRRALTQAFGARALRSTTFEVRVSANRFEFIGRGFGHGVGLCQAGAFARLAAGASVREVLAHYYPGTSVE